MGLTKADPIGTVLLDELRGGNGPPFHQWSLNGPDAADLLLPIHIKKGDLELGLCRTFMTFGTPQDVTLQELRIETKNAATAACALCCVTQGDLAHLTSAHV